MDDATKRTLAAIDAAVAWKPPEGPIVLSDEYLRLVERAEQLPENRPGTDKTWVERMLASSKYVLNNIREIPRE
ncbi:MAG: hypothetical protein ACI8Y8_003529 [Planctomycetota bacterium]|jgi:hypothetical protein